MHINDLIQAQSLQSQAQSSNFVYRTKNVYGVTGMEITGMTEADFKIVDLSDDITDKLTNLARSVFLDNYGMNDGEEMRAVMREYIASAPEKERINIAWTLDKIWNKEYGRIENLVSENISGWKVGKTFDRDFVSELISRGSVDQTI